MRMLAAAIAALSMSASQAMASEDYFAAAKAGKLACLNPNSETKTCLLMSSFQWQVDGSVIEQSEGIDPNTGKPTAWRGLVKVEGDRVCTVQPDVQVAPAAYRVAEAQPQVCMLLSPYGEAFVLEFTLDGRTPTQSTLYLRWVDRTEGYRVEQ